MRVLIMGGTTFVSMKAAMHFISKGDEVSIFTRGRKEVTYDGIKKHFEGDRRDLNDLKVLEGESFDVIIDVSAYTLLDVEDFYKAIDKKRIEKYIFISSGAVYESIRNYLITENEKRGHNKIFSDYGYNKYLIEEFLLEKFREDALPISILRPTYLYGEENVIYRERYFIESMDKNIEIPIPKSNNRTQFIYIDDLMKMIDSLIENENTNGEAFNATNETTYSFMEMMKEYEKALNMKSNAVEVNPPNLSETSYFPYRDVNYCLSMDKARKFKVYVPDTPLSVGLKNSALWVRNNEETYSGRMNQMEEALKYPIQK